MRKHIVIDYINIVTMLHLVRKHKGSNVTALFRPKSKFKERFQIKILNTFDIKYQLDIMQFSKLPVDPYKEVFGDTKHMADKLNLFHGVRGSSKTSSYFNSKLKRILFNLLYRPNAILKYVEKYNTIDGIYISIQARNFFLNQYYELLSEGYYKKIVFLYNSSGKVDDKQYVYRRYVSKKSRFLAYILFIPLQFKSTYRNIESLFFSHDKKAIQSWINGIRVGNSVNFKYEICWPDGSIGQSSDKLRFRHIYWKDVKSYLFHLKDGLVKFYPVISTVSFNAFSMLVRDWVCLFLLKSFYKKHSVRIIYSNFDSDFTQLALAVASDHNKIVSFSAIWSVGSFPIDGNITLQKFADRFFIWGEWHYGLLSASNDKSSGYVITGYIGDIDMSKMQKNAALLRSKYKKKYNNIIALYDTSAFHDLFFSLELLNELLKVVMRVAAQSNSLVILKTKFESDYYRKSVHNYSNNLIVDSEKGSLIPALAADVVIGIEGSTPIALSAQYNKRVINFYPTKSAWKYRKLNAFKDIDMVDSLEFLDVSLLKKLNTRDEINSNMIVTPFIDGKSQFRMAQYMNDVSDKIDKGKVEALAYSDSKYIDKHGFDKIIINE